MIQHIRSAWDGFVLPMLQRPKRLQVAALCYRGDDADRKVLLVTSRGTGRWIIPKGWPIRGMNAPQAARQEAWEEAGVARGRTGRQSVGSYTYDKTYPAGMAVPVETLVYPVAVEELADDFPEADARKRRWVTPAEAADMVQEPELQSILRDM